MGGTRRRGLTGAAGPGVATIAREWARIGVTGFGGPPAHIALLRRLVVDRRGWIDAEEFEDANAACGLLPGPASTQLAILCALRVGGPVGAVVGGLGFIVPSVGLIIAMSIVFLGHDPPVWVRGAGAGAGGALAAVAADAGRRLLGPSFGRASADRRRRARWIGYVVAGGAAAVAVGGYLVLVLLACGLVERSIARRSAGAGLAIGNPLGLLSGGSAVTGGLGAVAWTALKVGALSYGGGFVIVPLMRGDAVNTFHWMTGAQFLNAVALGQVTPGPVVATVAAVGYAAHGLVGALVAATVAFAPSFAFVLAGGRNFDRLRGSPTARGFLDGAGPAAIGAILGAAITLAGALHEEWQFGVLGAAGVTVLGLQRGVVETLVVAGAFGAILAVSGAPV